MITVHNEFETIPAFENIAGPGTDREITVELINVLSIVSSESYIDYRFLKEAAETTDDDHDAWIYLQDEIAEAITDEAPIPAFCTVKFTNGEWTVTPYIDGDLKQVEDIPEDYIDDHILEVNCHGNVTCWEWSYASSEYKSIWGDGIAI